MKTHYIYNKKNGQILHVHISDDGQDISRTGILNKVDASLKKNELDILTTDEMMQGDFLKIDVIRKQLINEDSKKKSPAGFGFSEQIFTDTTDSFTGKKTIYQKKK